jgi:hypothetical protein
MYIQVNSHRISRSRLCVFRPSTLRSRIVRLVIRHHDALSNEFIKLHKHGLIRKIYSLSFSFYLSPSLCRAFVSYDINLCTYSVFMYRFMTKVLIILRTHENNNHRMPIGS